MQGEQADQLVRRVTAFTAACVLVSNMIGTGIFGTTGFMARDLGSPLLIFLLWAVGGGFALLGALSYCELGTAMPQAGGEYVYIREAYGPLWGFLSGWTSFTIGFGAAIALSAHLFAIHLQQLLPETGSWLGGLLHPKAVGLAMVWSLTIVHVWGVGVGGFLQRVLTVIKVAAIGLLILAGFALGKGDWSGLATGTPGVQTGASTILISFLFVTFSYSGWNAAGYIAGEISTPGRSIPRAMIWGTLGVGALYLALNAVYLYALPVAELAREPIEPVAIKASVAMFGPMAGRWIAAMLCISIMGAASAMIWTGPRVYYAMARDGLFPRVFGSLGATSQAPSRSIVLQSLWVSVLVIAGGFEQLVVYASFVLILFTGLAVGAVLILRTKRPDMDRPYRVSPYPLVPLLYLTITLAIIWAVLKMRPTESLLGVVTVLAGVPLYFFWKRRAAASP